MGLDKDFPRPHRARELTPGLTRHVAELYESGMSRREVARKLDLSESAVYRAMKIEGVQSRKARRKPPTSPPPAGPTTVRLGPLPTLRPLADGETFAVSVSVEHATGARATIEYTGPVSRDVIRRIVETTAEAVKAQRAA